MNTTTVDRLAGLVACAVATGDPAEPAPLISYLALRDTPHEHLELVRPPAKQLARH